MATAKSIAVRTEAAIRRIEEQIAILGQQAGTPPADLRTHGRTVEIARAAQLEAIADALAVIVQAGKVNPAPATKPGELTGYVVSHAYPAGNATPVYEPPTVADTPAPEPSQAEPARRRTR